MPFTISHAIYAVPIRYIKPAFFSVSGLVLGSMSPDFEYFIMLEPYQSIGHTLLGLLLQGLPLSLILALLFEFAVKLPLSLHLSALYYLDRRVYQFFSYSEFKDVLSWFRFILSVCIGFGTHIFLDAFTHKYGYFVTRIPLLQKQLLYEMPIYKLLQYSLSVIGLIALIVIIMRSLARMNIEGNIPYAVNKSGKRLFWTFAVFIMIIVVFCKLIFSESSNTLGILVVSPISGFIAGVIIISCCWQFKRLYNERQ